MAPEFQGLGANASKSAIFRGWDDTIFLIKNKR